MKKLEVICLCKEEEEEVCDECGGLGYITTMERVYPGEPHMAPIGEISCPKCQSRSDDDYDDQED